jgi:ribose transport system substrate-binding protein
VKSSKFFPAVILGLTALIAVVTGFMIRESGNPVSPEQIQVIIDNSSDNRWVQFIAGMQKAAEDQNVKLTVVPTDRFHSIAQEKELVESAVSAGADGVILQLISDKNAAVMLEEIGGKIHVELVDEGESEAMGYIAGIVSPDHKAIGKTLAEEVAALYPGALGSGTIGVL